MLHLLPCARQGDIRLRAKHSATKADYFFAIAFRVRSFKLFRVIGIDGKLTSSFTQPHRKSRWGGGSDVVIAEARKWAHLGRSIAQATVCSRMSPRCGCVVALRPAEKQHSVCFEAAGTFTSTTTCHCRLVAILRLCCSVAARVEVTSYACVQKKSFECLFIMVCVSFLCDYYFLTSKFV
jgi:hypothetical protein